MPRTGTKTHLGSYLKTIIQDLRQDKQLDKIWYMTLDVDAWKEQVTWLSQTVLACFLILKICFANFQMQICFPNYLSQISRWKNCYAIIFSKYSDKNLFRKFSLAAIQMRICHTTFLIQSQICIAKSFYTIIDMQYDFLRANFNFLCNFSWTN